MWLRIKQEGLRGVWSMFPLTRATHFGTGFLSHGQFWGRQDHQLGAGRESIRTPLSDALVVQAIGGHCHRARHGEGDGVAASTEV